jgi:ribosomal protein L3 glutamine methyltransferase
MNEPSLSPNECAAAVDELSSAVDFIRWGASRIVEHGVFCGHGAADAVDEALALVLHAIHLPFGTPDSLLGGRLTRRERLLVVELLARRINERVPGAYLTGETWFAGMRFLADDRALVPRSPFAEVIERQFEPWIEPQNVQRIADLGTGGGCIAIACAQAFPDALVDAVDICPDALALAGENVALHDLEGRVRLHEGNLFAPLEAARYDIIVSNPPYVPAIDVDGAPPEFAHEPRSALLADDDGMAVVDAILASAHLHLTENGVLFVEVGASWPGVEERYSHLPFQWVDLERGGEGIFVIERDGLVLHYGD